MSIARVTNKGQEKSFSIKEVARISTIKAHTIRIWEQRYQTLLPQRNKSNTRIYSITDIAHLLKVKLLLQRGYKISAISDMDKADIAKLVVTSTHLSEQAEQSIADLIVHMYTTNSVAFEEVLDQCVLSLGIASTLTNIILPFLERVNLLSYADTSSATHLVVTAVRQKIILGIEQIKPSKRLPQTALLFLNKGEHYDLMLLYMSYVLRSKGLRVLYMGTNNPERNLHYMLEEKQPDYLYTFIPEGKKFLQHDLIGLLATQYPNTRFTVVHCEPLLSSSSTIPLSFVHYKEFYQQRIEQN